MRHANGLSFLFQAMYKLHEHIAKALARRPKVVRTAPETYNKNPPALHSVLRDHKLPAFWQLLPPTTLSPWHPQPALGHPL